MMKQDNELYLQRIAKEKRKCFIESSVINVVIVFYTFFALYYLYQVFTADFGVIVSLEAGFIAGFSIAALILGFLWTLVRRSPGRILVEKTNRILKTFYKPNPKNLLKTFNGCFGVFILILTIILGWNVTRMSLYDLFSISGMEGAYKIFDALTSPNFQIIGMVLEAMVETIFIALMATALAIPVAFLTSFLCARNLMNSSPLKISIYNFFRFIFNITRSVEPIIWAIIFSVWVGIGPFAGMLALMLHSVASLAKLYSEQIENIDRGPIEAIETTGANAIQIIWYAVVPQIVLPFLSFTIYRWDINVRMATIIGLVGGGGVGTLLMQYQGIAKWNEVGTIVIVIAAVVWLMDYISARVREAIY